jgi:hypothetical protein
MAGAALIFKYQWRAHWRRLIRIRDRTQFYLLAVAVLIWVFAGLLPARLSQAARELRAGQTTSMESVLLILCLVWLAVLLEQPPFVISSRRLLCFPRGAFVRCCDTFDNAAADRRVARSRGDTLTQQAGLVIFSLPAVAMIYLLRSDSALAPAGIGLIVVMVAVAYRASLEYGGRLLELRRHVISFRLS